MKELKIKINKYAFFCIWQFTKEISENTLSFPPENQSLNHIIISEFYEELEAKKHLWLKKSQRVLYSLTLRYSVARCLALELSNYSSLHNEYNEYNNFTIKDIVRLLDTALLNDYDLQLKKLL